MGRRAKLRLLAVAMGAAASGFFAYLAIRDVDFELFWATLTASDYWWFIPSVVVHFVAVLVRVVRWRLLFWAETRPGFRPAADGVFIGYFFDGIAPARTGDVARVVVLHQSAGVARSETLATVVTERVYDVLGLIVLLGAATPFLPETTWLRRVAVVIFGVAVVAVVALVVLGRYGERPLAVVLGRLGRLFRLPTPRAEQAGERFVRGLEAVRSARSALPAFVLTIVSWLVVGLSYWLGLAGLDVGAGPEAALLLVVATNFAFVVPSLPASLGVYEAAVLVALHPFGIDDSRALSCAVVFHVLTFVPFVAVGGFILHRHALSIRAGRRLGSAVASVRSAP